MKLAFFWGATGLLQIQDHEHPENPTMIPNDANFFSGKDGLIFDLFGFQSFADTSN